MIVRLGGRRGNDNPRVIATSTQAAIPLCGAVATLLRMCLILAIVEVVVPSTTPRRSVYGDQGQEVAWEVSWK